MINTQGGILSQLSQVPLQISLEKSPVPGLLSTLPYLAPQTFLAALSKQDGVSGTAQGKLLGAAALPAGLGHGSAPLKGIFVHSFSSGVTVSFCQQPGPGAKGEKGGGERLLHHLRHTFLSRGPTENVVHLIM